MEQRFDRITYEKGGSLEYQMHQFLGDASFYGGAQEYLLRYSHGNAEVTNRGEMPSRRGRAKTGSTVPARGIMDAWFLTDWYLHIPHDIFRDARYHHGFTGEVCFPVEGRITP